MGTVKPVVSSGTNLVYTAQAAVTTAVGPGGTPTTLGQGMAPSFHAPLLADVAFQARGRGRFSLTEAVPAGDVRFTRGPKINGPKGTIDMWLTSGAAGTARTVAYLADVSTPTPTLFIAIRIDTTNRMSLEITDELGTTVAETTPSGAAIGDGAPVHVRMTWDSTTLVPVLGGRHASLRVNEELVPAADWTTNPLAAWATFQPAFLVLGQSLGDDDYNGTIRAIQLSNTVSP